jgi:predicted nucleotidyltransferase
MVETLVSVGQFARRRRLSEQRVRQLIAGGRIPAARRIGARWALPPEADVLRGRAVRQSGAVASSPIERLIARRSAERLSQARAAAKRVLAALERVGVEVRVFGSLASGRMHPKSDLDLLVLARRGRSWAETGRIAAGAAGGFPFDLVFAETLSPGRLARLRAGSLDARDL